MLMGNFFVPMQITQMGFKLKTDKESINTQMGKAQKDQKHCIMKECETLIGLSH